MWLCCPSAFSPEVGPKVLSEAGEPASPMAPADPISAAVANGLNPMAAHSGTNTAAKTGTVPKEVPIPMVINKPTSIMTTVASNRLRSEEHTSELQSRGHLVCRLQLEKKKNEHNIVDQANRDRHNTKENDT